MALAVPHSSRNLPNASNMGIMIVIIFVLPRAISGHSVLSYPRPTSPNHCRMGGIPRESPIGTCPGPCELRNPGNLRSITNPSLPAATWKRGEKVTVKYQRNNHGPGGFVRFSLVPISKMMDKGFHAKNAFHYSCWGANPVQANQSELGRDINGYSMVGNDGRLHNEPPAYFTTKITVPTVIPNGVYAFGWVWYGGVGGSFQKNTARSPRRFGFFSDYWSCSFVRISGGDPITSTFRPVFNNDMREFWRGGCNAQHNEPGKCIYEPCTGRTIFQKPKPFEDGARPRELTPIDFQGSSSPLPTPVPDRILLAETLVDLFHLRNVRL